MKSSQYVAILAILNALLLCYSDSFAEAGEAKNGSPQKGGKAGSHMSSKGAENTNAQWSADPERGWVRAGERHELNGQGSSANKPKKSDGQAHGPKGKKDKVSAK